MDGYLEKENGHSLPNLEEARTDGAFHQGGAYNRYSGRSKRIAAFGCLAVLLVALVTGFSVGFAKNKRENEQASLEEGGDDDGNGDDDEGDDDMPRLQAVQEFLMGTISTETQLKDTKSAQYKAAAWMADEDTARLDIPDDSTDVDSSFGFVQRYVMAVFYYSLNGDKWRETTSFLTGDSVCDWQTEDVLTEDVRPEDTDPETWNFGVTCGEFDSIEQIILSKYLVCRTKTTTTECLVPLSKTEFLTDRLCSFDFCLPGFYFYFSSLFNNTTTIQQSATTSPAPSQMSWAT